MTFYCNPMGNLFTKRFASRMLAYYFFIFVIPVSILCIDLGNDVWKIWEILLILFLIPTALTTLMPVGMPRSITVDHAQLIWSQRLPLEPSEIRGVVTMFLRPHSRRTTVTVADPHAIEFLQTPIERLFNIGRIRFMGDIRALDAAKSVRSPEMPFYYGRIRKFDRFKEYLTEQLSHNAFIQ